MIKIETSNFVQGSYPAPEKTTRGTVGDFSGKHPVWVADTGKDKDGVICFEADIASGTAGVNITLGQNLFYDKDNFNLYTTDKGSGGEKGTNLVGYALSKASAGGKVYFRFRQKFVAQ